MSLDSLRPSDTAVHLPAIVTPGSAQETWIIGAMIIAALYLGQHVFVPLALAVLLTFVLAPLVRALRRLRVGRVSSVLLVVTFAFAVIFGTGAIITNQVAELARNLPIYQSTLKEKIKTLKGYVGGGGAIERASETLKNLQSELERPDPPKAAPAPAPQAATPPAVTAGPPVAPGTSPAARPIPVEVHLPEPTPLDQLQRIIGILVAPVATTGVVILIVVFMLLQREDVRDRAIRMLGAHDLERTTAALDDAGQRLSRYFLTLTVLNAIFGACIGFGLWMIGVPSPVLWGILAMAMRFVPFIGSFIAAAFPLLLAAAVDPGWSMFGWTLALYLIAEPIMGNVIEPLVQGHSTGLSPLAIVLAAAFWTSLWGPIGLLLAVPLTVVLVVLGRHVERLEFLSVLLGDTSPLSPAERFYQRMLADDPAEATEQAEAMLKEMALVTYYDDVVVAGLRLAQADAERGTLQTDRLAEIQEAAEELIEALSDRELMPAKPKGAKADADGADEDEAAGEAANGAGAPASETVADGEARYSADEAGLAVPEDWKGESAILCVSGRTALDEAVAHVLAQLLGKHGLGARVVGHPATAAGALRGEETEGVKIVCFSSLDARERSAYTRFLARRLKRAVPDAHLVGGLWMLDRDDALDKAVIDSVPVDAVVTSLREAVEHCLELASGTEPGPRERSGSIAAVA